jgi:hypothetical protein
MFIMITVFTQLFVFDGGEAAHEKRTKTPQLVM